MVAVVAAMTVVVAVARVGVAWGRGTGRARTRQPPMLRLPHSVQSCAALHVCRVAPFVRISVRPYVRPYVSRPLARPSAPHPFGPVSDFSPGVRALVLHSGGAEGAFRTAFRSHESRARVCVRHTRRDWKWSERIACSLDHVARPVRVPENFPRAPRRRYVWCAIAQKFCTRFRGIG